MVLNGLEGQLILVPTPGKSGPITGGTQGYSTYELKCANQPSFLQLFCASVVDVSGICFEISIPSLFSPSETLIS